MDDLQTHPGLSVSQTQLKVQQGLGVDTQLWTQHLHQRRVVLLRLDGEGMRRINLGLALVETSFPLTPEPPVVQHVSVCFASPHRAGCRRRVSRRCRARHQLLLHRSGDDRHTENNENRTWRSFRINPTNTCLFAPRCCSDYANFPNVGLIEAFYSKGFVSWTQSASWWEE